MNRILKKIIFVLCLVFALGIVAGCGASENQAAGESSAAENQQSAAVEGTDTSGRKVLIAYFSKTGTTQRAAQEIQKYTGGDLFRIETAKPYPEDYHETTEIAKAEKEENARPKLSAQIDNIDDYDVIFVGYPIWWHTAPMAVYTFLEQYDLSGKTVVPFCTSGGSDIEESVPAIEELCSNSVILKGLTANDTGDIKPWLEEIDMLK